MRKELLTILFLTCSAMFVGCGASVHTENRACLPKAKVTRTVTETTKVERPTPVYKIDTTLTSKTSTIDSNGNTATPLHAVIIPDATK